MRLPLIIPTTLSASLSLCWAAQALAHPGGLDASGCHANRKTGDYHCHRAQGTSRKPAPNAPAASGSRKGTPTPATYFPNCASAREAGAAPIYRGQPGYRAGLDRDGDGKACE